MNPPDENVMVLPEITLEPPTITKLPDSVLVLQNPETGGTVYIVGTAHISRASEEEVRQVIRYTVPNTIMLELCHGRLAILAPPPENEGPVSFMSLLKNQKTGLFGVVLAYMYAKVKEKLNIMPGSEFRAAYEESKKIPGCKIILGDRPVEITLKRTWGNLSFFEKIKIVFTMLRESFMDITEADIEAMKDSDVITEMLKEISKQYPGVGRPLIYERDEYLTWSLKKCPGSVVVGVVGLGHLAGIKKCWNQDISVDNLMQIPPPSWITPRSIVFIFLSLFVGALSCLSYWLFF